MRVLKVCSNLTRKTPRERFVALAEKRVNKALQSMRLVGNLFNRNNYSYTEREARQIVRTLEDQLRDVKRRFNEAAEKNRQFRLNSDDHDK